MFVVIISGVVDMMLRDVDVMFMFIAGRDLSLVLIGSRGVGGSLWEGLLRRNWGGG